MVGHGAGVRASSAYDQTKMTLLFGVALPVPTQSNCTQASLGGPLQYSLFSIRVFLRVIKFEHRVKSAAHGSDSNAIDAVKLRNYQVAPSCVPPAHSGRVSAQFTTSKILSQCGLHDGRGCTSQVVPNRLDHLPQTCWSQQVPSGEGV